MDLWAAEYDLAAQKQLCQEMAALIGFDFKRGRLDIAPHPFEISFTRDDVRITTRYDANYLPMSLFAAHCMKRATASTSRTSRLN